MRRNTPDTPKEPFVQTTADLIFMMMLVYLIIYVCLSEKSESPTKMIDPLKPMINTLLQLSFLFSLSFLVAKQCISSCFSLFKQPNQQEVSEVSVSDLAKFEKHI